MRRIDSAALLFAPSREPRSRRHPNSSIEEDGQSSSAKQQTETNGRDKSMKKLLLIGLAAGGLAFIAGERVDAQITAGLPGVGGLSFGFPGYRYAYPTRYNYYPYGYYQRPYYSYAQPYSYYYSGARYSRYYGHRTSHRHYRHHRYR